MLRFHIDRTGVESSYIYSYDPESDTLCLGGNATPKLARVSISFDDSEELQFGISRLLEFLTGFFGGCFFLLCGWRTDSLSLTHARSRLLQRKLEERKYSFENFEEYIVGLSTEKTCIDSFLVERLLNRTDYLLLHRHRTADDRVISEALLPIIKSSARCFAAPNEDALASVHKFFDVCGYVVSDDTIRPGFTMTVKNSSLLQPLRSKLLTLEKAVETNLQPEVWRR